MREQAENLLASVDLNRLHEVTGDDIEFLRELVEVYLEDTQLRVQELRIAVDSGDHQAVSRTAHILKGSSANVGAKNLTGYAKQLEGTGAPPETQDSLTRQVLDSIEHEFARVTLELRGLIQSRA